MDPRDERATVARPYKAPEDRDELADPAAECAAHDGSRDERQNGGERPLFGVPPAFVVAPNREIPVDTGRRV